MNKSARLPVAIALMVLILGGARGFADEPCDDLRVATDKLARALSISAGSQAVGGGTFVVQRTPPGGINAASFELTYVVSGKPVATATVAKGSVLWDEYSFLELKAVRRNLNVEWQTGGSGCCVCEYTIAATPRGFTVTSGHMYTAGK